MGSLRSLRSEGAQDAKRHKVEDFLRDVAKGLLKSEFVGVDNLLADGLPVPPSTNLLRWALVRACDTCHYGLVSRLLALGVDPNSGYEWEVFGGLEPQEQIGILPLHVVCQKLPDQHDVSQLVDVLLRHEADPNQRDTRDDSTPLGWAAANGQFRSVKLLIEAGAAIEVGFREGCSPLVAAAGRGHIVTVSTLLKNGADPNAQTDQGVTALMAAYSLLCDVDGLKHKEKRARRKKAIIRLLVERGANTEFREGLKIRPVVAPPLDIPT